MKLGKQILTRRHFVFAVLCLILYLVDVGTDILTAFTYGVESSWWWMAMTVLCIVLPRTMVGIHSIYNTWCKHRTMTLDANESELPVQWQDDTNDTFINERTEKVKRFCDEPLCMLIPVVF